MKSPYTVHIDPDKARELAESGAILLLLDVPHGTVVGIDQQVKNLSYIFRQLCTLHPCNTLQRKSINSLAGLCGGA